MDGKRLSGKPEKAGSSFRKLSNIEQRTGNRTGILIWLEFGPLDDPMQSRERGRRL
jgi:hypothetical protein